MIQDPKVRRNFEILTEEVKKLEAASHELGTIRATLEVNCRQNSAFGHYGFTFDQSKNTHDNMLDLLRFCNARLLEMEDFISLINGKLVSTRGLSDEEVGKLKKLANKQS